MPGGRQKKRAEKESRRNREGIEKESRRKKERRRYAGF
jgi:hypothetical protein